MKELTERKLPTPGSNPDIMEEQVKDAFVWEADILLWNKEELAVDMQMDIVMLCDSIELEKRQMEREVVVGLVERCVAENARVALTRTRIYNVTMGYNGRLVSRYETGKA